MKALFRFAIALALALAVGLYVRGQLNLENVARLKWIDEISVAIKDALASAKPKAAFAPVDSAAAALVDEELDYRIAQRIGSLEGWRTFLAAHGGGVYAQSARAEVEKLLAPGKVSAPSAAEVSNGASAGAKLESEGVGSPPASRQTQVEKSLAAAKAPAPPAAEVSNGASTGAKDGSEGAGSPPPSRQTQVEKSLAPGKAPAPPAAEVSNGASAGAKLESGGAGSPSPSPQTEVAALTPDEICNREGDHLERLRGSATSDEAQRFAKELGCGNLRPQPLGLTNDLGYAAPDQRAALPSPSVKAGSASGPKRRAAVLASRTHSAASARSRRARRHAHGCAFKFVCFRKPLTLPPIVLALIGAKPKHAGAFRRSLTDARPDDLRGR